jgi:hypothetical protein
MRKILFILFFTGFGPLLFADIAPASIILKSIKTNAPCEIQMLKEKHMKNATRNIEGNTKGYNNPSSCIASFKQLSIVAFSVHRSLGAGGEH